MKKESRDIESNCFSELFDAAIEFDKAKFLQYIRESESNFRQHKKFQQIVLKGYSSTKKMPNDELERKLCKYSTTITNPPCLNYFASTRDRFSVIYSSNFTLPIEDRIKKAIVLVSSQIGWPIKIVNYIINSYSALCNHFIAQNVPSYNLHSDLTDFNNEFELNLTKDAVAAWRINFRFIPPSIFDGINLEHEPMSPKWDPIREAVAEANEEHVAAKLEEIVKQEKEDFALLAQAATDLILIGVDLKSADLIYIALEKIENELLHKSIDYPSRFRLLTTNALAYTFLQQFDNAIASLSLINRNDKYKEQLLGFSGSIFLMAGKPQEASKLFSLVFKRRKTPLIWPLHALFELDPQLADLIKHNHELPASLNSITGAKINEIIVKQHPEWNSEDELISPLMPRAQSKKEHTQDKLVEKKCLVDEGQGLEAQVLVTRSSLAKELWALSDYLEKIISAEEKIEMAQRKRDWSLAEKIAAQLVQMGSDSKAEMERIIFNLGLKKFGLKEQCAKSEPIQKVLNEGEIDPNVFQQALHSLDAIYSEKLKREKEEIERQKAAFQAKLSALNLAHRWPKEELTEQDFINIQKELMPQIARAEKIQEIERGLVDPAALTIAFPSESERRRIVQELLNKVAQKAIDAPRKLIDLVCSLDWDESTAFNILNDFLLVLKRDFSERANDEICMINTILPFIVKISSLLTCAPLRIILQEPFLANFFNKLILPSAGKKTRDVLKSIVTDTGKSLALNLLEWKSGLKSEEILKEFLIKWIDFDTRITPFDKVEMLSLWLDSIQQPTQPTQPTISEGMKPDIECFHRLRDGLVECKRIAEATVLVSALWSAFSDERILEGFEIPLYDLLADLLKKGGTSSQFAHRVLESPEWLIKQEYGVILFLHLCHLGSFVDLVEQARYQFFTDFEQAKEKNTVLVGQFFLDPQFTEGTVQSDDFLCSEAERMHAQQAMKDLEHALKRPSCYKTWAFATEYQRFFNEKIMKMRDRIIRSKGRDLLDLEKNLDFSQSSDWIQDADRKLHSKAKHQARDLMGRYLEEQLSRLREMLKVKKKIGDKDFIAYLHTPNKPLRERLNNEASNLKDAPPKVVQIYNEILGAVK